MSDLERAALLLDVIESAAKHGPAYTSIAAEAAAELKEMNDDAAEEQREAAKAEAEEKAKAEAERTAFEKAEADREAKRIFPKGSGVVEDHDPPRVQRKV